MGQMRWAIVAPGAGGPASGMAALRFHSADYEKSGVARTRPVAGAK